MIWGLITDTHDRAALVDDAVRLFEREGCSRVFHAGDVESERVLRLFGRRAFAFHHVTDHESHDRRLRRDVPFIDRTFDGLRVFMLHDTYRPVDVEGRLLGVRDAAADNRYDIVLYGHLHYFNMAVGVPGRRPVVLNSGGFYYPDMATVALLDTAARTLVLWVRAEGAFRPALTFPLDGPLSALRVLDEAGACTFADALSRHRWKSKDRWEYAFTEGESERWFSQNYRLLFERTGVEDKPAFFYQQA